MCHLSGPRLIAGTSYGAYEAGAQATAQSERTKPVLVANRFQAISQASMMSTKLRETELASQSTQVRMRAWCDRGILRVVRGSELTGAATSSLRDRCGRQGREHARFPRESLGRGHGVRDRWLDGFRREERLGRVARARGPLAIITARVVLLLPVVEQGLPRLFGCS
jgi:hypothetical protein